MIVQSQVTGSMMAERRNVKNISSRPHFSSKRAQADITAAAEAFADGHVLAGLLVHEFNNLLTPIIGYAEMAADALRSGSSSRMYVERIRDACDRAKRAVERILMSDMGDEGFSSFDAAAAIREILPDLHLCIPSSCRIQTNLPNRAVWLDGREITLQQVVINLCKNAGEAMKAGGTVTVNLRNVEQISARDLSSGRLERGEYARLSVSDTGPGISPSFLERIFDPFFTTKSREGGSGLGLALVQRAVGSWGGAIDVHSSLGKGTIFELFLPCSNCSLRRSEKSVGRGRHSTQKRN
ncbi:putative histidine kinase regulatory protein (plasmid) [Rhizobium johnstonii 3841]|uniref:histidine kinase n=1 Tax=Rhizobium johnstonii (strain DSM 114642 / LMG 32736 / 3841) TaxID=216596 RepID=Q1M9V3_RHIJ3|nr:ATP-binding protein [Rhizobium leguminosarum]CAK11602.1 putative histidine kinase regulatory protein [Rhizobium johnstonii 3841]